MNMEPVHKIEIDHRWQEVDKVELDGGNFQTTEQCLDCCAERDIFHLTPRGSTNENDMPIGKMIANMREPVEQFTKTFEMLREMFRQLVNDSLYSSFDDLVNDIERRYGGEIDGRELPFFQLERWSNSNTKKFQRKEILAFRQGLVCNRCDSVVYSLSELTIDHIIPKEKGGKENLANLQLLCQPCNGEKGNFDPTERDVSPFSFHGEPCIHRITCVEVDKLRRSHEEN